MKTKRERYDDRTCALINAHKVIVLRAQGKWYLRAGVCLQSISDTSEIFTGWSACAMQFADLEFAFIVAKHLGYKVYSRKVRGYRGL